MAVVAYLRVSTEKQFLENQREEIVRFAERNGMSIDKWYTETVSGSVSSKERKLSGVLDKMRPGDSLIVTEISRLSRTLLEIMTILNSCIKKGDMPKMKILAENKKQLLKEQKKGTSCSELARRMGVSRTTMFRFLHHKR